MLRQLSDTKKKCIHVLQISIGIDKVTLEVPTHFYDWPLICFLGSQWYFKVGQQLDKKLTPSGTQWPTALKLIYCTLFNHVLTSFYIEIS